jgi:hypothetical protein
MHFLHIPRSFFPFVIFLHYLPSSCSYFSFPFPSSLLQFIFLLPFPIPPSLYLFILSLLVPPPPSIFLFLLHLPFPSSSPSFPLLPVTPSFSWASLTFPFPIPPTFPSPPYKALHLLIFPFLFLFSSSSLRVSRKLFHNPDPACSSV